MRLKIDFARNKVQPQTDKQLGGKPAVGWFWSGISGCKIQGNGTYHVADSGNVRNGRRGLLHIEQGLVPAFHLANKTRLKHPCLGDRAWPSGVECKLLPAPVVKTAKVISDRGLC